MCFEAGVWSEENQYYCFSSCMIHVIDGDPFWEHLLKSNLCFASQSSYLRNIIKAMNIVKLLIYYSKHKFVGRSLNGMLARLWWQWCYCNLKFEIPMMVLFFPKQVFIANLHHKKKLLEIQNGVRSFACKLILPALVTFIPVAYINSFRVFCSWYSLTWKIIIW